MEKKKISAKEALADIRSGMSDADLMSKYVLSDPGLQSLFDKLVTAGYIDLSEIMARTPSYAGTVDIPESFPPPEAGKAEDDGRQPAKSKHERLVNAQEAARDIRSGMDDFALMQKYRLSYKNLSSLFQKLIDVGLLQQVDIDHRNLGFESTVALAEDMLSVSAAFAALGSPRPAEAPEKHRNSRGPAVAPEKHGNSQAIAHNKSNPAQRREPAAPKVEQTTKKASLPAEKPRTGTISAKPDNKFVARAWYDNPAIVMLLLVLIFPVGLYACFRNSSLSIGAKTLAVLASLLFLISIITIFLTPDWLFSQFM